MLAQDTVQTGDWWARPRGDHAAEWVSAYQKSLQARHRSLIVKAVKDIHPESLLEVGCHCGPNLVRLAQELPELDMIGIDASAEAITSGRSWVEHHGFKTRIQLNVGRVPDALYRLPSGSFDVVLSCYTLAYVAPSDLDIVLYELGRLATHAVILAEPMTTAGSSVETRSMSGYTEWAHNYVKATKWIGSWHGKTITTSPVAPPVDRLNGIVVGRASSVS